MKSLIVLVVGLLSVGCGKPEQPVNTYENKKRVGFLSHRTEAKPVKELTAAERLVGTYEGGLAKIIFWGDGNFEYYSEGNKVFANKWKIIGNEVYIKLIYTIVHKIEPNGDLTELAEISGDGKRKDIPKELQSTYKKIK